MLADREVEVNVMCGTYSRLSMVDGWLPYVTFPLSDER